MARRTSQSSAPSKAQIAQSRAVQANRSMGRLRGFEQRMFVGDNPDFAVPSPPVSMARDITAGRNAYVDPETDIYSQSPVSRNDPDWGSGDQGNIDAFNEFVDVLEFSDQYFDPTEKGGRDYVEGDPDSGYRNLAWDVVTPTTRPDMDTAPAPMSVVPTNTINPARPRTVAAGYDRSRKVISVVFRDGTFYNYYRVDPREWQAFKMSRSKGRYIKAHLDGKPRGYADVGAVPVNVRSALYNVMRAQQIMGAETNERWQQPDLYDRHVIKRAQRQSRKR